MNKTYKVYKYAFPNGKVYIGMTSLPLAERRDCGYQHNPRLQEAISLYGWAGFSHEVLIDGLTEQEASEMEQKYISEYDATNPNKGYNVSLGGRSTFRGLKHSEEHKKRMSELYRGKHFSDEHLKHLREAHAKERIAVRSVDTYGRIVNEYDSLGNAANDVGGHKSNISRACKSGKPYKGVYWRYAERGEFTR